MINKLSVPLISLIFFVMAIVWIVGAVVTYGESMFWLFIVMVPINIFAGMRALNK